MWDNLLQVYTWQELAALGVAAGVIYGAIACRLSG
jgi:hypothetical protein